MNSHPIWDVNIIDLKLTNQNVLHIVIAMEVTNIYVLELEGENYYVGKTHNINKRYQQHLDGTWGSAWTKLHKPIRIIETLENVIPLMEDTITKKYMADYGVTKVRGAEYVTVTLSKETIAALEKTIWAAEDRCLKCGGKGHFVAKCFAKTTIDGRNLVEAKDKTHCDRCGRDTHLAETCKNKTHVDGSSILHCDRCDRDTHLEETCKNKTYADGTYIDKISCDRCGRDTHLVETCKNKTYVDGSYIDNMLCTRCGRDSHLAKNCTSKTKIIS